MRALVAQRESAMGDLLGIWLRRLGCEASVVHDGHELRGLLRGDDPVDFLIIDVRLPGWSAFDVLEWSREQRRTLRILVVTEFGQVRAKERAEALGADAVLAKPFPLDALLTELRRLFGSLPRDGLGAPPSGIPFTSSTG